MFPSLHESHPLGLLVLAGIAASLAVAVAGDPPSTLPGIALGSTALLYVEKTIACFSAYLLVLVVVVRAFSGELPSELRGVRYAVEGGDAHGTIEDLKLAVNQLDRRLDQIERVATDDVAT
jgi:hypothetical protein